MKTQPIRALHRTRMRIPTAWDITSISLGCALMAISFRIFTNGNHIVSGGVVGLSTLAQKLTGLEPGLFQWMVNVPLLGVGFPVLGRSEGLKSAFGSLILPLAIYLTRGLQPITSEPVLAAVFGGVVYGAGLGLVLQGRGAVGGYSLIARVISKYTGMGVTSAIFTLDALTIAVSARVFGFDLALYGLLSAYLMRRSVEWALVGLTRSVIALIITHQSEAVKNCVLVDMDRGMTVLSATGAYSGQERNVLMVVISQSEVPALRQAVKSCDPKAFVVMTNASEVLGSGFGSE